MFPTNHHKWPDVYSLGDFAEGIRQNVTFIACFVNDDCIMFLWCKAVWTVLSLTCAIQINKNTMVPYRGNAEVLFTVSSGLVLFHWRHHMVIHGNAGPRVIDEHTSYQYFWHQSKCVRPYLLLCPLCPLWDYQLPPLVSVTGHLLCFTPGKTHLLQFWCHWS